MVIMCFFSLTGDNLLEKFIICQIRRKTVLRYSFFLNNILQCCKSVEERKIIIHKLGTNAASLIRKINTSLHQFDHDHSILLILTTIRPFICF